jgi:hypothetical protein
VRRNYGRTFLRSLPTRAVKVMPGEEILKQVREFFATG